MSCTLNNVTCVVKDNLCTGCGVCVAVCPERAIAICSTNGLLIPKVDENKCTDCGLCQKCCPGRSLSLDALNLEIFGKQPEDSVLGNYSNCYLGHSDDPEIRFNSASGGTITQLLLFALENRIIDGAVVVRMKKDNPLETEAFVAKSREELLSASKSKYCPVSLDAALNRILAEEGRFAVVGLSCHIWGIRKAEAQLKKLKERIVFHVGLFCSHTVTFLGTELLLRKFGLPKECVESLDYRGCGWPGRMTVRFRDGSSREYRFVRSWNAYWNVFSPFFFAPVRCLICSDQSNELSDVSVGDAWLRELRGLGKAESMVIARTAIGDRILRQAAKNGALSLVTISPTKVKESQAFSLNFKKDLLAGRIFLFGLFGQKKPTPNQPLGSVTPLSLAGAFLSFLSYRISTSKHGRALLLYSPLPLFRLYFGLFKTVFMLSSGHSDIS